MKVAFIDRDGTIIRDYPDSEWSYITEPDFLEDSIKGIQRLIKLEYEIIIITNQYIINEGIISLEQYNAFSEKILSQLVENAVNVLDVFYCRHTDQENCECKKPKTGMFKQALSKYSNIKAGDSIMIGDSESDRIFADSSGLQFFGIKGGNIKNQQKCHDSINEIAKKIELIKSKNVI